MRNVILDILRHFDAPMLVPLLYEAEIVVAETSARVGLRHSGGGACAWLEFEGAAAETFCCLPARLVDEDLDGRGDQERWVPVGKSAAKQNVEGTVGGQRNHSRVDNLCPSGADRPASSSTCAMTVPPLGRSKSAGSSRSRAAISPRLIAGTAAFSRPKR